MPGRKANLNTATFNAVIHACGNRAWRIAIRLLEEMEEKNVKPDVTSYTAAISACSTSSFPGGSP